MDFIGIFWATGAIGVLAIASILDYRRYRDRVAYCPSCGTKKTHKVFKNRLLRAVLGVEKLCLNLLCTEKQRPPFLKSLHDFSLFLYAMWLVFYGFFMRPELVREAFDVDPLEISTFILGGLLLLFLWLYHLRVRNTTHSVGL